MEFFEMSLLSNLIDVLYNRDVSKIDRETLIQYTEGILNIKQPTLTLINKLESYYQINENLPESIDDFSTWHLTSCLCGRITEENLERGIEACTFIISRDSRIPSCQEVLLNLEFYNIERRFPSTDELVQYLQNLRNLDRDPEEYHQENKVKVCTPNLHLLKGQKNNKEDNCGLCFESIQKEEECFKLPCGHIFHSEKEKCLNDTILKWLYENKNCPICKKEVNLE